MKAIRHVRSIALGIVFGIIFAASTGAGARDAAALVTMAFMGTLIPNLDINFATKLSRKEGWLANAILIPFLITLITPKGIFMNAFFLGYSAHIVNDLDKKGNIDFALQRAAVGLVWFLSVVFVMGAFGLSFGAATSKLFG